MSTFHFTTAPFESCVSTWVRSFRTSFLMMPGAPATTRSGASMRGRGSLNPFLDILYRITGDVLATKLVRPSRSPARSSGPGTPQHLMAELFPADAVHTLDIAALAARDVTGFSSAKSSSLSLVATCVR